MDIGKSFSYVTEDPEWLMKILIGALPAVIGWMVEIIRRVSNNDPTPLPDWDNLGDYFVTGLKLILIIIVWQLPLSLLLGCGMTALGYFSNQMSDQNAIAIMGYSSVCVWSLSMLYGILIGVLIPPMLGLMADGVNWTSLFNPKPSFDMFKRNIGGYILALLLGPIIGNLLSLVGIILCGVGFFFGSSYGAAFYGHLIGQAHAKAKAAVV
jgi:hypothetical protein